MKTKKIVKKKGRKRRTKMKTKMIVKKKGRRRRRSKIKDLDLSSPQSDVIIFLTRENRNKWAVEKGNRINLDLCVVS